MDRFVISIKLSHLLDYCTKSFYQIMQVPQTKLENLGNLETVTSTRSL